MSINEELSFGCVVLVDDALRLQLQQALLKGKNGLLGVSFLSLSTWLKQFSPAVCSEEQLLFACRRTLCAQAERFPIFRSQLEDSAFLSQCARFVQELKLYAVPTDALPQRSASERELKEILDLLSTLDAPADARRQALEALRGLPDASHIRIYPSFFSLFEQQAVDLLIEKGAKLLERKQVCTQAELFHAVNMRQEIEGIAQQIIARDLDADDIALCALDPFYESLAAQIFRRYRIPYTILTRSTKPKLSMQMQAWLRYVSAPDERTLQELLSCGAFDLENDALLQYLQLFSWDVFEPIEPRLHAITPGALFDAFTLSQLSRLEEDAIQQQQRVAKTLKAALACSPKELLSFLCDFFIERYPSPTREQVRCMQKIQQLFTDVFDQIATMADLAFLAQRVGELRQSDGSEQLEGVLIHSLEHLSYERPIRYLCGAVMNAWPGFTARSGIFDERYCEELPLPSMDVRYQHHLAQCEKLFSAQQQLIVTYPLGSYEGKSNEASLEIEQKMAAWGVQVAALPLQATHQAKRMPHDLDGSLARALYLQDGGLRGSISALERYRLCPFSYFLRYGLRLKKRQAPIGQAQIGSLIHELLQQLCETYGKAYVKTSAQELRQRIEALLQPLHVLFPKQQAQLHQLSRRLCHQMEVLLETLDALEEHSHLRVKAQEQPFRYTLPLAEGELRMEGVIDRIDVSNHMAVVLDYKSSRKTLSPTKVASGLQLQLLTYAVVLQKGLVEGLEDIRDVLGAFYISTRMESVQQPAIKISRQKKESRMWTEEDMREELEKKKRLTGWIFSENIDLFDDDATHVANLKQAEGKVVGRDKNAIRSLSALGDGLQEILTYLGESILQGAIACEPGEGACDFCDYHCICRYRGQPWPKAAIIDEQGERCLSLPKEPMRKEEDVDAELE